PESATAHPLRSARNRDLSKKVLAPAGRHAHTVGSRLGTAAPGRTGIGRDTGSRSAPGGFTRGCGLAGAGGVSHAPFGIKILICPRRRGGRGRGASRHSGARPPRSRAGRPHPNSPATAGDRGPPPPSARARG